MDAAQPNERAFYESTKVADVKTVNVEELANRKALYYIIHAEETDYFARDPTTRDKTVEQFMQQPLGPDRMSMSAHAVMHNYGGLSPDEVLRKIDETMDTTPRSDAEYVALPILSFSWMLTLREYAILDTCAVSPLRSMGCVSLTSSRLTFRYKIIQSSEMKLMR